MVVESHGFYWSNYAEEELHQGEVIAEKDGVSVIDCRKCGFAHINPIPEVGDFYRDEFYTSAKPQYIQQYLRDNGWWNLKYEEFYDFFDDAVEGNRILDFGSGPGFFLDYGQGRGWDCYGVEPSEVARDYARGLNQFISVAPAGCAFLPEDFDVIHSYEVFEHLADPGDTLTCFREMLKPEGILSITVPNDFNQLQALREEKYWISAPEHINYFTFDTIERLIEDCGFDILERRGSFPMELFWLLGWDYVGDETALKSLRLKSAQDEEELRRFHENVGRDCHLRRVEMEKRLPKELRINLYRKLAEIGIGREATIFARKR
jgi:SAM-dependent methyltransferase